MERDISGIEKYYAFEKKEWVAFRIFWTMMGVIVVAASFGLFGKGLLSDKTYATGGIQIQYNKFMRVEKANEILIRVTDLGKDAKISINNDYLNKVRIEQVTPEPTTVEIIDNKLVYTFSALQNGFVTFYLNPQEMGSHQLIIFVNGKQMRFDQFIYL